MVYKSENYSLIFDLWTVCQFLNHIMQMLKPRCYVIKRKPIVALMAPAEHEEGWPGVERRWHRYFTWK